MDRRILQAKGARELGRRWNGLYYLIECPSCGEQRWIAKHDYLRSPLKWCVHCNWLKACRMGRKKMAQTRLEKIKQLLVCKRCGNRAFYEDEEGWDCIICGCIIYKHRVKLASLVKV